MTRILFLADAGFFSSPVGIRVFLEVKKLGHEADHLTTHIHLVPWLRMHGAIPTLCFHGVMLK
jgi:hypothetical protein